LNIKYTSRFKKDYKKIQKQQKDINKLKILIEKLVQNQALDDSYLDHPLSGNWKTYRECHIAPDWLLIYKKTSDTLILIRTGSHANLFKR
jgi:mRNA interferase YafQ